MPTGYRGSPWTFESQCDNAAPIRLHPNLAKLYRCKVSELEAALADLEIRDEALAILRPLIDKVVLRAIDGGFEIELIGEVVAMVALGQKTPKSKTKKRPPSMKERPVP